MQWSLTFRPDRPYEYRIYLRHDFRNCLVSALTQGVLGFSQLEPYQPGGTDRGCGTFSGELGGTGIAEGIAVVVDVVEVGVVCVTVVVAAIPDCSISCRIRSAS